MDAITAKQGHLNGDAATESLPQDVYSLSSSNIPVFWAASHFLASKGIPAKVNTEIFETLVNSVQVHMVNWSSYTLKTLKEYKFKLKKDMSAQTRLVCLDGCLPFLEAAYLDNLRSKLSTKTHTYRITIWLE